MARLTDHDVRDAEHALRSELALLWGRYGRRMHEAGKGEIQVELEAAALNGEAINGTEIGRRAAARAALPYFGGLADGVHEPVENGGHDRLLEAPSHP